MKTKSIYTGTLLSLAIIEDAALEKLKNLTDRDPERGHELIDVFEVETRESIILMKLGLEAQNLRSLKRLAFNLKSSAANFGAVRIQQLSGYLEAFQEDWSPDEIAELIDRLEGEFRLVMDELNQLRS